MRHLPTTAILLFARTAPAEAAQKRWCGNAKRDRRVAQMLHRQTLRAAHRTGLPLCWVSEADQTGSSFGQRLATAVARTFRSGYQRLLIIGNDCPQLTTEKLRRAAALLEQNDTVLGPAKDGGVYLLGLSRAAWSAIDLTDFAWQTDRLCAEWRTKIPNLYCLQRLRDVDVLQDILRLPTSGTMANFVHRLMATVGDAAPRHRHLTWKHTGARRFRSLRAPPAAAVLRA